MTYADQATSPRRNWRFLTAAQKEVFELDEATLIAIDHARNAVKNSGQMSPQSYRFLLQEQANQDRSL